MRRFSVAWCLVGGIAAGCGDNAANDASLRMAPLAEPTAGSCPDVPESGPWTFQSGGVERTAHVIVPEGVDGSLGLMFVWHGLSAPEYRPAEMMIEGFDLAAYAAQMKSIVVVPVSETLELPGVGAMSIWNILDQPDHDLALFDDLRSCLSKSFDVDLNRVTSWGHSGGALWNSVLIMERSDALSAVVSLSGGIEIELPMIGPKLFYSQPAEPVPVMLVTGGEDDVWPEGIGLIRFEDASDRFADALVDDGHLVARCRHDGGHFGIPAWAWEALTDWQAEHRFGELSPFEAGDRNLPDACELL